MLVRAALSTPKIPWYKKLEFPASLKKPSSPTETMWLLSIDLIKAEMSSAQVVIVSVVQALDAVLDEPEQRGSLMSYGTKGSANDCDFEDK